MRSLIEKKDPDQLLRSSTEKNQRINTLIDTVFGIAVTLTIFSVSNPNTFDSLLSFTQTLPAFLFSISILFMLWKEIVDFSSTFHINDFWTNAFVLFFLSLVIFFVFPLRFLMLLLSNIFFNTQIEVNIENRQVIDLMIYYGGFLFAIYFLLFLLYFIMNLQSKKRKFNSYERFFVKWNIYKTIIYISVPIVSILIVLIGKENKSPWAVTIAGFLYSIYGILLPIWGVRYGKRDKELRENLLSEKE